jgi:hypothetical protein
MKRPNASDDLGSSKRTDVRWSLWAILAIMAAAGMMLASSTALSQNTYIHETIDSTNVPYARVAIASDEAGSPYVIYCVYSPIDGHISLRYAWTESGVWSSEEVVSADAQKLSLRIDGLGKAHATYLVDEDDRTYAVYANNTNGTWQFMQPGGMANTSSALLALGPDGSVHMMFWDRDTDVLWYMHGMSDGTFEALPVPSANFSPTSIAVGSDGVVHAVGMTSTGTFRFYYVHHISFDGSNWSEDDIDGPSYVTGSIFVDADEAGNVCALYALRQTSNLYSPTRLILRSLNTTGWGEPSILREENAPIDFSRLGLQEDVANTLISAGRPDGVSLLHVHGNASSGFVTSTVADVVFLNPPDLAVDRDGGVHITFAADHVEYYTTRSTPRTPTNLQAEPGPGKVLLSWDPPVVQQELLSYNVQVAPKYNMTFEVTVPGENDSCTISLNDGVDYEIRLQAVYGDGPGPFTGWVAVRPPGTFDPPSAIHNVSIYPYLDAIFVQWSAPTYSNASQVREYSVRWGTAPEELPNEVLIPLEIGQFVHEGLDPDIVYYYQVRARNDAGWGPYSATYQGQPYSSLLPSAPTDLAAYGRHRGIDVTWSAPAYSNWTDVTNYLLEYGLAEDQLYQQLLLPADARHCNLTGLQHSTVYYFRVTAQNLVGWGTPSNVVQAMTDVELPPSAPRTFTLARADWGVWLLWQAPAEEGSYPVEGYWVYRATEPGAYGDVYMMASSSPVADSNVENGATYYYRMLAFNAAGPGALTGELSATPMAGGSPPSAPLNVTATNMQDHALVTWVAPSDVGDSEVIGYELFRNGTEGGVLLASIDRWTFSYQDETMAEYVEYSYWVRARNGYGYGANSTPSETVVGSLPTMVVNLMAQVDETQGWINLTWDAPLFGPVSGYLIMRNSSANATWTTLATVEASTSIYRDEQVDAGTTYSYRVAAFNPVGVSFEIEEVSATVPEEPTSDQGWVLIAVVLIVAAILALIVTWAVVWRKR